MLKSLASTVGSPLVARSATRAVVNALAPTHAHGYATAAEEALPQRNEFGVGGRSSVSGVIATVLGSSGFAGRYVVNRLGRIGSQVLAAHHGDPLSVRHLKVMGDLGQIVLQPIDVRNESSLEEAMYRSNVVINLVGKRWKTRNFSLAQSNHDSARTIAKVAKRVGVEHFVHVSALGANENSPSEWAREKAKGEKAVREVFPDATIIRPGPLFGAEDRFLTNWAHAVRNFPAVPIYQPDVKFHPLCVHDLGAAIAVAVDNPVLSLGETFELATDQAYTQAGTIKFLNHILNFDKKVVSVPRTVATLAAKVIELQRRPRWYTTDEVAFWDDPTGAVFSNSTLRLSHLGLKPTTIEESAIDFVRHYRKPQHLNLVIE